MLTLFPHLAEVGDTKEKANGVQDVGLARAIKPSDGIEERVKAIDFSALAVALEAINYHRLDIHLEDQLMSRQSVKIQTIVIS